MNSILVKLKARLDVEFEQPISWFDIPTKKFYLSRNFWLGILLRFSLVYCDFQVFQFCSGILDNDNERIIGRVWARSTQPWALLV